MNKLFSARAAPLGIGTRWALRGAVLDSTQFKPDALVVFRDARIEAVGDVGSAATPDTTVEVDGLIVPGLVDAHNHLPWSVFRRWAPPTPLRGRFDWRGKTRAGAWINAHHDPYYRTVVDAAYKGLLRESPSALTRLIEHGAVRSLIGGATTVVVDADLDPGKPVPALSGTVHAIGDGAPGIWGVLDVSCLSDVQTASIKAALASSGRLLVHLGEGSDDFSRGEFRTLTDKGLLAAGTCLVHAFALELAEWEAVRAAHACVAWSPSSNLALYGRTLDLRMLEQLGIPVALAPDWSVTGSATILDEVRFTHRHFPWISPSRLLDMVTRVPATILCVDAGTLAPGKLADALVISGQRPSTRDDALHTFAEARVSDVGLVVVNGTPVYGSETLMARGPARDDLEALSFEHEGRVLTRTLRFRSGEGESFASLRATLDRALTAQGRSIAPLWE